MEVLRRKDLHYLLVYSLFNSFRLCIVLMSSMLHEEIEEETDCTVQGTNDSSIVSKCSMVQHGYFTDPFLHKFVGKSRRRSPLIHRGYYIRAKAVDYVMKRFLDDHREQKTQILSLGAGFDSSFFRLYTEGYLQQTTYYEVDFPDVVRRKIAIIENDPDLKDVIQECAVSESEVHSVNYHLIGGDLRHMTQIESTLTQHRFHFDVPTLVLSECVLTYLPPKSSDAVIHWCASKLAQAVFVLYEQILPSDSFGKVMTRHFDEIGSRLRSIDTYPTLNSQIQRFNNLDWSKAEALDMNHFYTNYVSQEERARVESLEPFDETEGWHQKCSHYIIVCAYTETVNPMLKSVACGSLHAINPISPRISTLSQFQSLIQRFGHTSVMVGEKIITIGGFGCHSDGRHGRSSLVMVTSVSHGNTVCVDGTRETGRMYHTCSVLSDGSIIIIGGRESPTKPCSPILHLRLITTKSSSIDFSSIEFKTSTAACNSVESQSTKSNTEYDSTQLSVGVSQSNCSENINENQTASDRPIPIDNSSRSVKMSSTCQKKTVQDIRSYDRNRATNSDCEDRETETETKCDDAQIVDCDEVVINVKILDTKGDNFTPRWRHSVVEYRNLEGKEKIMVYGGRTTTERTSDDCWSYDVETSSWEKLRCHGNDPGRRQSHTANIWGSHMVITGGTNAEFTPLHTIHLLNLDTYKWSLLHIIGQPIPRYSHTAHIHGDTLVLLGGVNPGPIQPQLSLIHLPRYSHTAHIHGDTLMLLGGVNRGPIQPPLSLIHLPTGACQHYHLPETSEVVFYHGHTSVFHGPSHVVVCGGGSNCFSFGTHFNKSPIVLDVSTCLQHFVEYHNIK